MLSIANGRRFSKAGVNGRGLAWPGRIICAAVGWSAAGWLPDRQQPAGGRADGRTEKSSQDAALLLVGGIFKFEAYFLVGSRSGSFLWWRIAAAGAAPLYAVFIYIKNRKFESYTWAEGEEGGTWWCPTNKIKTVCPKEGVNYCWLGLSKILYAERDSVSVK